MASNKNLCEEAHNLAPQEQVIAAPFLGLGNNQTVDEDEWAWLGKNLATMIVTSLL